MRAGVFIDGAYLVKAARAAGIEIDYENLALYLLEPICRRVQVDLMRVYFYDCAPFASNSETDDELRRREVHERFFKRIESIDRWEYRKGKLERRQDGNRAFFEQKRVDVKLSVDLVHHASAGHMQYAVLVAGDSDFIPAVNSVKHSGVTVLVWGADRKSLHRDLAATADMVEILDWSKFPGKKRDSAPSKDENKVGDQNKNTSTRRRGTKKSAPEQTNTKKKEETGEPKPAQTKKTGSTKKSTPAKKPAPAKNSTPEKQPSNEGRKTTKKVARRLKKKTS